MVQGMIVYAIVLNGMFWKKIDALDRDLMKEQLVATDRSLKEIFGVIMELHAKANNKTVQGAKFPLHYSFAELLVRWFPGCKIIHTARDPRAIYSSQSNKYTRREYSFIRNAWIRTQQVAHICIQTEWTSRIHEKLKDGDNYMLSRYEDLVLNPAEHMKRVCRFLGVEYRDEMAAPRVFSNSSFQETRGTSGEFHKKSIYAWKGRISPLTASFIGFLNGRAMRRFGYSVTESEN